MSAAMMKRPSFSAARRAAHPYARTTVAYPEPDDARRSTVEGIAAAGKVDLQLPKPAAPPAVGRTDLQAAGDKLPPGFRAVGPVWNRRIVPLETEQAACDAYRASIQHWCDTVHGAWRRRCAKRRSKHFALVRFAASIGEPEPDALVLPPEPQCDVALPACVQRYIDSLNALTVADRAEQCRCGVGGHPGMVIARRLLLDTQRVEFAASDVALANERARLMAEAARIERSKEEESGPNGETLATHDKQTEVQKCGGKGQTIKVVTWAPKRVA